MVLNQPISDDQAIESNQFIVNIDGVSSIIESVQIDAVNNRVILFEMEDFLNFQQNITIDYVGSIITSSYDSSLLNEFFNYPVNNSLPERSLIPGKIQAEDYNNQSGLSVEDTNDVFGGQNIGSTDTGDYAEYLVLVEETGLYELDIRYAASFQQGIMQLEMINNDSNQSLGWFTIPITGDWQNWYTLSSEIQLTKGAYTLKMTVLQPGFNINWLNFTLTESLGFNNELNNNSHIKIYPNPAENILNIDLESKSIDSLTLYDINGRQIFQHMYSTYPTKVLLNLPNIDSGIYILRITSGEQVYHKKVFKK